MASSQYLLCFTLYFFFFFSISSSLSPIQLGRKVGGMVEIKDVKTNKDVQDLGKFCIDEFNKNHNADLAFSEVVKADKQAVAGVKYYLTIKAADKSATVKSFDAVVVVKEWLKSKELLSFMPSNH